jgi:precorrin-2 dehydrogenase/sirohydrochlorin ferrochelatase
MIPLMVDVTGRQIAICGGGEVSARKAAYFAEEAIVSVYSRSFAPAFESIPVKKVRIELKPDDESIGTIIRGAFLVIAATSDPSLNEFITSRCQYEKILCNSATTPGGDVILPAQYRGDRFMIAVSTLGASPAVPRFIREHLQESFPCLDQMIVLEEELRRTMKENRIPENERRRILHAVIRDDEVWKRLSSGPAAALSYAHERYLQ